MASSSSCMLVFSPLPTLSISSSVHSSLPITKPHNFLQLKTRKDRPIIPLRVSAPPTTPPIEEQESSTSTVIQDDEQDLSSYSKFSWRDNWYPVSLVEDLDPSLPTPFQLLNRDMVIWFDKSGSQWVVLDDKCPHRLAPLSFSWRDNWYTVSLGEDIDPSLPTPFQLLNRDMVIWFDKSGFQWVVLDDKCPHRLAPLSMINKIRLRIRSFLWRDNWYPVSPVEDLDATLHTPFQLLDRDIVLWFDKSGSLWVALDDKCPHCFAPLSEGRLDENGHLQCSYHGWSFNGCGSCTRIPQAASEGPEAKAFQSPRATATRFPTMVSQGLLFVWPDENGWERAQATKPPMLPEDFDKPEFATVTIQRDLFYGYDTLMENVSDPSHIDFAHHKVTGRRDRAKPLPFKMEASGPWGFAGANNDKPKISAKFVAPCYSMNKIEIDTKLPIVGDQKWVIWICSFNVPMAPGKTRSIVCSARNFFQFAVPGPAWWQVFPRWQEHWTSNKVYDGDMIVLQGQEKIFLSKSKENGTDVNKDYTKLTFTPTQADRFVLAFRNWLRRHGNSQPEWFGSTDNQPLPSTVLSKRQMMDRFEQHTLKCSSCRNAYYTFERLQKFLIGTVLVCCATAGIPSDVNLRIILGSLAIISAGLAYILHELQKNFIFVDYVHAEID